MGGEFARNYSPPIKFLNEQLDVAVYFEGDQPKVNNAQFETFISFGRVGKFDNMAQKALFDPQIKRYQALLSERQAQERVALETQRREQAERQARERAAERAAQESRERERVANEKRAVQDRYNAFVNKNHVDQLINTDALEANPFIYEGKIVALNTAFSKMQTADRGLFNRVVVSGVPGNLFTAQNMRVVLAGKVLGKTSVKTPFGGEVSMTHLQYVGVYFCTNLICSDLIPQ